MPSVSSVEVLIVTGHPIDAAPMPVTLRTTELPVFSLESMVNGNEPFRISIADALRHDSDHPKPKAS